jgi:hypothetical protein
MAPVTVHINVSKQLYFITGYDSAISLHANLLYAISLYAIACNDMYMHNA